MTQAAQSQGLRCLARVGGRLALLVALAGCAAADRDEHGAVVATTRHDCGNGLVLEIAWQKDVARITVGDGESLRLPRAISASGARYADDTHEAWEHQGVLRWTDGEAKPRTCHRLSDGT